MNLPKKQRRNAFNPPLKKVMIEGNVLTPKSKSHNAI